MTGETLGNRYKLIERLGGGGMAVVYKAMDNFLDRTVTVKILRSEYASDESFVSRFRKEAQSVARLSHPNIVNIYDVGTEGDIHYLVMEYVEGQDLKTIIRNDAPLPPEQVLDLAVQVCEALQHAHENDIVHRDVKPHNILVTPAGKAKLTDFGIAKEVSASTLTYGDNVVGSVHYISPEQARGELAVPSSDVYSLGAVIYEMLTGVLPFEGDTPIGVAMKHIQEDTRPLWEIGPDIPESLARVVHTAMEKLPEDRFESAIEMAEALKNVTQVSGNDNFFVTFLKKLRKKRVYNKKRLFLMAGIPIIVIIILTTGVYAFSNYMNTPDITVPDVTGKPVEEARSILMDKGLEVEVGDRIYSEEEEGIVIHQDIGPDNYPVKSGREITLTISRGPDLRTVPDLTGMDQDRATTALLRNDLVMAIPVTREHNDEIEEGKVFAQSPEPGESVESGSRVEVKISMGPEHEELEVPDLVGKEKDEAISMLSDNDLGFSISWERSREYMQGRVIEQDPRAGEEIEEGENVELVLSSGPGPEIEKTRVEIDRAIPNDGISHKVKIIVEDAEGIHTEYADTHNYGDRIEKEIEHRGQAKIQLYVDDELKAEEIVGKGA